MPVGIGVSLCRKLFCRQRDFRGMLGDNRKRVSRQVRFVFKLPTFPLLVWLLLAGTLLTRTAFFIVWPFVAIILQQRFQLAPSEIGIILGSAALASSVTGFYLGNL